MSGEKTFKGTAGDWRYDERSLTGAVWAPTDLVASVYPNAPDGWNGRDDYELLSEMQANARLIAGAKGLLMAAQILASLESDDGGRRFPTKEEIAIARAAISQALGGEA